MTRELRSSSRIILDDLDRWIIAELRRDGRAPSAQIARKLGAPEATVRYRIGRLRANGLVVTMNMPTIADLENSRFVIFFVRTRPCAGVAFTETVKSHPDVRFVAMGTGYYDVYISAVFPSAEELLDFRDRFLGRSDAVERLETMQIIKVVSRAYDVALPSNEDTGTSRGARRTRRGEHSRLASEFGTLEHSSI